MTPSKRVMDLALALIMAALLAPIVGVLVLVVLMRDGRPVFYASTRARQPGVTFRLWKFRTMLHDNEDKGVSGGDKSHRITRTGRFLRRSRLDEVPQLWNVIKGDISFVGPRPPLPEYVDAFPELYAQVLKSRPGITGLATLTYHRTEERLLASCHTPAETEEVYKRRCIPRKARLDLLYAHKRSLCSDLALIAATGIGRKLPRHMALVRLGKRNAT
ncbi:MAG: sugar transferase [Rhodobacteraceae bacterium]|nr:sugar transferase [Paracoccaceae bacterium]